MMNLNKVVCENIRKLRISEERSQEDVAFDAELSVSHLSKLERGITSPTIKTLSRIANALDVPIDTFFKYSPND